MPQPRSATVLPRGSPSRRSVCLSGLRMSGRYGSMYSVSYEAAAAWRTRSYFMAGTMRPVTSPNPTR